MKTEGVCCGMKRFLALLLACLLALTATACGVDADLRAGKAALEAGEYPEAYTRLSASSSEEAAALLEKLVFVPAEKVSYNGDVENGRVSYTYDAHGHVLTVKQAFVDHVTDETYTYDEKHQLLTIEKTGSTADKTTYTYDEAGNRVSKLWEQEDIATEWLYTYDEQHRMLKKTQIDRPSGDTFTETYRYDDKGNRVFERNVYPDGVWYEHRYEYDEDSKPLHQSGADSEGGNYEYVYTYDEAGLVIEIAHSSGWTRTYTYDARGRMLSEEHTDGLKVTYTYDEQGNVLEATEYSGNQWSTVSYTYDSRGNKLSKAYESSYGNAVDDLFYTYDAYGNKLTEEAREGDAVKYRWEYSWELYYYPDGVPEEVASIRQSCIVDQPYM